MSARGPGARVASTGHDDRRNEAKRGEEGEPVARDRQTESTPVKHPVLGPAVELYSDRRQSWGALFLDLAFLCLALLGFVLGLGDLSGGTTSNFGSLTLPPILGLAEILGAVVMAAWAIRAGSLAIGRIRRPALLVVGRDGFEYLAGNGPVGWDEVESVADANSPDEQPRTLKVQLNDPGEYARRHSLSPVDRAFSLLTRGDLVLGHETIMPVAEVQALMRERLAEFRGVARSGVAISPAALGRKPKRRAQAQKK
jgi:hypothetical protein